MPVPTVTPTPSPTSGASDTTVIIVVVVLLVIFALIVGGSVYCCCCYRNAVGRCCTGSAQYHSTVTSGPQPAAPNVSYQLAPTNGPSNGPYPSPPYPGPSNPPGPPNGPYGVNPYPPGPPNGPYGVNPYPPGPPNGPYGVITSVGPAPPGQYYAAPNAQGSSHTIQDGVGYTHPVEASIVGNYYPAHPVEAVAHYDHGPDSKTIHSVEVAVPTAPLAYPGDPHNSPPAYEMKNFTR